MYYIPVSCRDLHFECIKKTGAISGLCKLRLLGNSFNCGRISLSETMSRLAGSPSHTINASAAVAWAELHSGFNPRPFYPSFTLGLTLFSLCTFSLPCLKQTSVSDIKIQCKCVLWDFTSRVTKLNLAVYCICTAAVSLIESYCTLQRTNGGYFSILKLYCLQQGSKILHSSTVLLLPGECFCRELTLTVEG